MAAAVNHNRQDAQNSVAVTPSDTTDLSFVTTALYIGVAGDVTIIDPMGNTTLYKGVPVGILPVSAARVKATGTTATNIVAIW